MALDRMFGMIEGLRGTASANAVWGEPREVDGRVLIPIAVVSTGFGLGFGQDAREKDEAAAEPADEGGGGGGGAKSRPVAVIEVTPQETVIRPIVDEGKVALAGIALVGWIVFCVSVVVRRVFGGRREG